MLESMNMEYWFSLHAWKEQIDQSINLFLLCILPQENSYSATQCDTVIVFVFQTRLGVLFLQGMLQ